MICLRRFFTEPQNITDTTAIIYEDAAHITRVLRMKPEDKILIFDGTGMEYTAELVSIDQSSCVAHIISAEESRQEPKTRVTIYQGIPKSDKMESIIQKSVELGVYKLVPVMMDRCIAKLENEKKQLEKIKRWKKISVEAAKQCGRGILPEVALPISFSQAIDEMTSKGLAIMPYEMLASSSSDLKSVLSAKNCEEISVIIGPEGGFSDKEAELAKNKGVSLVGLGPRILRTETVSSAILGIIMYEKNEI